MTPLDSVQGSSLESLVAEVADDFVARQQRGEEPDIEDYAARHPHLAAVIAELRRGQGDKTPVAGEGEAPVEPPTTAYVPVPAAAPTAASTAPRAGLTTDGSVQSAAYFRAVARLGEQAAEALDYAHQM